MYTVKPIFFNMNSFISRNFSSDANPKHSSKKSFYHENSLGLVLQDNSNLKADIRRIFDLIFQINHKIDRQFNRLDAKIDHQFNRLDAKIDHQINRLDTKIDHQINRLDTKIDQQFNQLNAKIEYQTSAINSLNANLVKLQESIANRSIENSRFRSNYRVAAIGTAATVLALAISNYPDIKAWYHRKFYS